MWLSLNDSDSILYPESLLGKPLEKLRGFFIQPFLVKVLYAADHGNTSKRTGWEIDHILLKSKGGQDHLTSLQPLHWENNRKKSDDFPATLDHKVNKGHGFSCLTQRRVCLFP